MTDRRHFYSETDSRGQTWFYGVHLDLPGSLVGSLEEQDVPGLLDEAIELMRDQSAESPSKASVAPSPLVVRHGEFLVKHRRVPFLLLTTRQESQLEATTHTTSSHMVLS